MFIGITGHQDIPENTMSFVRDGIALNLRHFNQKLVGISSLAAGADQLFAEEILRIGGKLYAVIPCEDYDKAFKNKIALDRFHILLESAGQTEQLEFKQPSENAFFEAGIRIVELSQVLFAVWDGHDIKGKGGTADIVKYAKEKKVEVIIIWPTGVVR